jgi:NAD(P)-dependent dehydrogenase (short-subunit alcohol dehydrogenase family)
MQNIFSGQVAIITGAGQGIGYEIAYELAANGCAVVLNDLDENLLAKAVERIQQKQPSCIAVPGDASDIQCIGEMIEHAVKNFGLVTVAIANAGITLFGDFLSYSPESFNRVMQVNLGGSFFLAQAAANQMKKQGRGGSILFMSSVTAHQAHKQLAAYGMTKAALELLAKTLVIELAPFQITVNTIAPGATLTERTKKETDYENIWSDLTPTGRPATTSDIAHAALFMVSPLSKHITGQSLVVDGGWTAISPSPF